MSANVFEDTNNVGINPDVNKFDWSHTIKASMNAGNLYPIKWMDCIPGQKLRINPQTLIRMMPTSFPAYTKIDLKLNAYFVPYSIIWDNFPKFINKTKVDAVVPTIAMNVSTWEAFSEKKLSDYLGLPPVSEIPAHSQYYSQLPFRAYQKIWNDWYRNQNVQDEVIQLTDDVVIDNIADTGYEDLVKLRKVQWRKDYITSAVPEPQFGEAIGIPVEFDYSSQSLWRNLDGSGPAVASNVLANIGPGGLLTVNGQSGHIENLEPEAVQITIEQLRWNVKLQMWAERIIRTGKRYKDYLWSTFRVRSSDARLDMPEFIGGDIIPISISEVLDHSDTTTGAMAGHGIGAGSNYWNYEVEEHGLLMITAHIVPVADYPTHQNRFWFKSEAFDWFTPDFANLGYQEITCKELYPSRYTAQTNKNDTLFGYIPRYSEYKFQHNEILGEMRTSLSGWSWNRPFDEDTAILDDEFVECDPNYDIFQVTDGSYDHFQLFCYLDISTLAPVPYINVPQL